MATAATAKTPSTHLTMMAVLCDGDTVLCVAEELLDVEGFCVEVDDEFVLVEGELLDAEGLCVEVDDEFVLVGDSMSTLCYNKIIQPIIN
jgi:hypothetical protein